MVVDLSSIYRNRVLPKAWYMVEVVRVETKEVGQARPIMQVDVRIEECPEEKLNGTVLSAILHPTPKSERHWEAFESAFEIEDGDFKSAVGRSAVVYCRENIYEGTVHGVVEFCQQTQQMRQAVANLTGQGA